MFQILDELRLSLRPEKTFVGRNQKGFDLLGYHITLQGFSPSQKTQEKALKNAKYRHAQGGKKSLLEYLNRWRTWVHAGLPLKVHHVDAIIESLVDKVTSSSDNGNSQRVKPAQISLCLMGLNITIKENTMDNKFLRTLIICSTSLVSMVATKDGLCMNNKDNDKKISITVKKPVSIQPGASKNDQIKALKLKQHSSNSGLYIGENGNHYYWNPYSNLPEYAL